MFEQLPMEACGRTTRPWTVLVSFALQIAGVGAAILVPLIATDSLPPVQLAWTGVFTPSPPPGPAPGGAAKSARTVETQMASAVFREPDRIPDRVAQIVDLEPLPEPSAAGIGFGVGVPGGIGLPGALNPVVGDAAAAYRLPAPPPVEDRKPALAEPLRIKVGGLVQPPMPRYTPQPLYPRLASQARISGVVRLEAVVGTDGSVRNVRLLSGHPMLAPAAIAAVREWRYTPTLLNGDPVEVVMQIDVHFTLRP